VNKNQGDTFRQTLAFWPDAKHADEEHVKLHRKGISEFRSLESVVTGGRGGRGGSSNGVTGSAIINSGQEGRDDRRVRCQAQGVEAPDPRQGNPLTHLSKTLDDHVSNNSHSGFDYKDLSGGVSSASLPFLEEGLPLRTRANNSAGRRTPSLRGPGFPQFAAAASAFAASCLEEAGQGGARAGARVIGESCSSSRVASPPTSPQPASADPQSQASHPPSPASGAASLMQPEGSISKQVAKLGIRRRRNKR
jgi:hypothetical protein